MQSPRQLISVYISTVLLLLLALLLIVLQQSTLGFTLVASEDDKLVIDRVDPLLHMQGLRSGDELIAIAIPDGIDMPLYRRLFPANTLQRRDDYELKRDYYIDQTRLYRHWHQVGAQLVTANQHRITMQPLGVDLITVNFLMPLLFGCAGWLLGLVLWVWHPQKPEAHCLMLSGLGFFILAVTSGLSELQGVLFHPLLHWCLHWLFILGHFLFLVFGISVLLYFPRRLYYAKVLRNGLIVVGLMLIGNAFASNWLTGVNFSQQLLFVADLQLYRGILLAFVLLLATIVYQWLKSAAQPLARMQTYWVISAWLLGPTIYLVLYMGPMYFNLQPLLTRAWTWPVIFISYALMFVLIGRFRLLNNETYLAHTWQWCLATLMFLVVDMVLVYLLQATPQVAILIVVVGLIWGYLPLRYLLVQREQKKRNQHYAALLHEGVEQLFAQTQLDSTQLSQRWQRLLCQLFNPIAVHELSHQQHTTVDREGQVLLIAASDGLPGLQLEYAEQGTRLFYPHDQELVITLQFLHKQIVEFRQAFGAGREQERQRIRRDLHDHMGHQLLSLIYAVKDDKSRQLAQSLMVQLKQIIRSLKPQPTTMGILAINLKEMAELFAQHAGIEIDWRDTIKSTHTTIGPLIYINLLNITRELLSNAVRHAQATNIVMQLSATPTHLTLIVADDGQGFLPEQVQAGNGLLHINQRVAELDGHLLWHQQAGSQATISIPLEC